MTKLIALLGLAAVLAACSHTPPMHAEAPPWDGGIWNSVLGYHGPDNARVAGGPSL